MSTGPRRSAGQTRRAGGSGGSRPPVTLRLIIWGAFVAAVFVYGVVGFVVPAAGGYGGAGSAAIPGWLFPAVALFLGVAALLVPTFLSGREVSAPGSPIAGSDIITWAMDEAIAVVGLVTVFLGGSTTAFLAYLGASLILLVIHRPRG